MRETGIRTRWVNSDRQIADVLTKPQVPNHSLLAMQSTGRWKIVFDDNFTSAKKLRKQARDASLKQNTQNAQQRALQRSIVQDEWIQGRPVKPPTLSRPIGSPPKTTFDPDTQSRRYRTTFSQGTQIRRYQTGSEQYRDYRRRMASNQF